MNQSLGELHLNLKNYDKALTVLNSAMHDKSISLQNRLCDARTHFLTAQVYRKQGLDDKCVSRDKHF